MKNPAAREERRMKKNKGKEGWKKNGEASCCFQRNNHKIYLYQVLHGSQSFHEHDQHYRNHMLKDPVEVAGLLAQQQL